LPDGRLLYRLKRRWRDGTTHVIYEPLELIERLAALVHPPRFNITRFYGIFAPTASLRPRVIPEAVASSPSRHAGCQSSVEAEVTNFGRHEGFGVGDTNQGDRVKITCMGRGGASEKLEAPATDPGKNKKERGCQPRNYSWASLMERLFELDVLACPRCGGRMRILAAIDTPDAIDKILACLGLPTRAPPIAPAISNPNPETAYAW
jgi:Putative transposase